VLDPVVIETISAVTLKTSDMRRAVAFYRTLGFVLRYGGEEASFTSFSVGATFLNLEHAAQSGSSWGRVVFYVSDVDALHQRALAAGLRPSTRPRDAQWNERFFHISDPDGHELSFAQPLGSGPLERRV